MQKILIILARGIYTQLVLATVLWGNITLDQLLNFLMPQFLQQ